MMMPRAIVHIFRSLVNTSDAWATFTPSTWRAG